MSRKIIIELLYVTSKIILTHLWYCFDTLIQGRIPFCISELSSPDYGVAHCVPYSHHIIWKPKSKFIFIIYKTNPKVKQNNFIKFGVFLIYISSGKGQLISKRFLGSSISSKKRTNEFVFTSMRRVFVRFLEEIDDLKKLFRN